MLINNIYEKVLLECLKNGVGESTSLTNLFSNYAIDRQWDYRKLNIDRIYFIEKVLIALKENNHIKDYNLKCLSESNDHKEKWNELKLASATITAQGVEYIENRILLRKTLKSYSNTKWLSWIAIVISILSVLASYLLAKGYI